MSQIQERNRLESKDETTKNLRELCRITGLDVFRIKRLLASYTMTEIRNGRTVRGQWVPKESVVAKYVPQPNHVAAMAETY